MTLKIWRLNWRRIDSFYPEPSLAASLIVSLLASLGVSLIASLGVSLVVSLVALMR